MQIDVTVHKRDGVHRCLVTNHGPIEIRRRVCCDEAIPQRGVDEVERRGGRGDGVGDS